MKRLFTLLLMLIILCSCGKTEDYELSLDSSAPVIEFSPVKETDGASEFYLFDDNPEYLNSSFLADGENPNAIAYFDDLQEGIYTAFSYHHRGESVGYEEDLYFDVLFSGDGCEIEILQLGLDHNWDWNQAWADFTGTPVSMPEYFKTFECTCGRNPQRDNGMCKTGCPAIKGNELRTPAYYGLSGMNEVIKVDGKIFLSDIIPYISENDVNKFRYGGPVEPMWLMMKFRVLSGNAGFATVAYTSKEKAFENAGISGKGEFVNEPQYKGIADSAPFTVCEFNYNITKTGVVPVTVKNARVPDGNTDKDGWFATFINTWRLEKPIAVESDMLPLRYADNKMDMEWRFDPLHTKLYEDNYSDKDRKLLKEYGVTDFVPNIPMSEINHPAGAQVSSYDFYRLTACNLGNFGVTTKYVMYITNSMDVDAGYVFEMKSDAGQVYRYSLTDETGNIVYDDGGQYTMKRFDSDPAENKSGGRIEPADYSTEVVYTIPAGRTYTAVLEVTTLTGCNSPMQNRILVR